MTPKEKAEQLYNMFDMIIYSDQNEHDQCKMCSIRCVDEIELYREQIENEFDEDLYHAYGVEEYWQEVKQEIKKL